MTKENDFIYTTYIQTTPEKLWQAITTPEFTKQYWDNYNVSEWKKGAEWKHLHWENGSTLVIGKVLECDPPKRLVLTWASPDDLKDVSEVSFNISTVGGMVRLDVVHGKFNEGSEMGKNVKEGWPRVLSSLKTFLESGTPLNTWDDADTSCHPAK